MPHEHRRSHEITAHGPALAGGRHRGEAGALELTDANAARARDAPVSPGASRAVRVGAVATEPVPRRRHPARAWR